MKTPTCNLGRPAGTLRQCRSQKFQKCVRKLSEICQKTVSYIKLSEICPKCVRNVSEMCQLQNSVQNVSDQNQKCLRNLSKVKNVSVNYQFRKFENCQNSIRKVSYDRFLTQFCTQIVNYYNKKTVRKLSKSIYVSEMCQKQETYSFLTAFYDNVSSK